MKFKQRTTSRILKGLVVMVFLMVVAFRGVGGALTLDAPLQLEGDRLTGHLSQVPLRTVLQQLQKQLGITYEAPAGELDKIISVDLQQTPILPALAKILAPWDYAFTVNAAGHLQFLYITPKALPAEAVSETSKPPDVTSSNSTAETGYNSLEGSNSGRGAGDVDRSLSHEHDSILPPSSSAFASPPGEISGIRATGSGVPMAIQPVPSGTTMPMVPASGSSGMQVTPAVSSPNMPIIPATAYPPMDIQPVPGYLQEEMLRDIAR